MRGEATARGPRGGLGRGTTPGGLLEAEVEGAQDCHVAAAKRFAPLRLNLRARRSRGLGLGGSLRGAAVAHGGARVITSTRDRTLVCWRS